MVRADLPRGLQAAQIVHAAGESSPGNLVEGTHAVVLTVPDEAALLALSTRMRVSGVVHVVIVESDAPYEGQAMALGFRPNRKEVIRRHLSSLPLLR